jgi:hypothetical protein
MDLSKGGQEKWRCRNRVLGPGARVPTDPKEPATSYVAFWTQDPYDGTLPSGPNKKGAEAPFLSRNS